MIFKYMMFCKYPDGNGGEKECATQSPAYFHHQNLACLHDLKVLEDIQMKDIYITNNVFKNLSKRHSQVEKVQNVGPAYCNMHKFNSGKSTKLKWLRYFGRSHFCKNSLKMAPILESDQFLKNDSDLSIGSI